jgi:hypothetical protein
MESNYFIFANLFNPVILFFILGIIAGLLKSDLELPSGVSKFLHVYLLIAIGFKGGVSINEISILSDSIIFTILAGISVSFILPFIAYKLLSITSNLDRYTIAAVAASYGSVSIVTFMAATNFLNSNQVSYVGYIIVILALMEVPAIFSGLILANRDNISKMKLFKQILTSSSILLLFGGLIIGWVTGKNGLDSMKGFIVDPFQGMLAIFLLDMGLVVSKNINKKNLFNFPVLAFSIYMPMIGAVLGLFVSKIIGLDVGTGLLFITLCASSSYIAVPAAMKMTLPQANASIYIPMSLSITFPFNIIFGIPFYYIIAKLVL